MNLSIRINIKLILTVIAFMSLVAFSFTEAASLEKDTVLAETIYDDANEGYEESIADRIITFEDKFNETEISVTFKNKTTLKDSPLAHNKDVLTVVKYDTATLIGTNDFTYWKIRYNGSIYYVNKNDITTSSQEVQALKEATHNTSWSGQVLNRINGAIYGPTGKETYYNLDMSGVIAIMRRMGNNDIYWIRDDGVKMLGDYVIVAANLELFPRGSLVPCSLGMGIVCDTGGFAQRDATQLDIAVNW